jgi:hypothetical protein
MNAPTNTGWYEICITHSAVITLGPFFPLDVIMVRPVVKYLSDLLGVLLLNPAYSQSLQYLFFFTENFMKA